MLFISPSAYPIGGVATWLSHLLPDLEKSGWFPTLGLTSGFSHDAESYLERHPYSRIVKLINPTGSREGRVRVLARVISDLNPDLVIVNNIPDSYEAILRVRRRGHCKIRICAAVHGFSDDLLLDLQYYSRLLDAVTVTNLHTRAVIIHRTPVPENRVFYAPYGVAVSGPPTIRTGGSDILRIGYSGRFEETQKRVTDILQILRRASKTGLNYEFLYAGDGPELAGFQHAISKESFAPRCKYLGSLLPPQLAEQLYRRIDILLITSEWETGPIVAWEAMSEGAVVLSSRFRGCEDEGALQSEENCLLFNIGNDEAAVQCLIRLQDPELRASLRMKGYQLVDRRYSRSASAAAWDKALRSICTLPALPNSECNPPPAIAGSLDRAFGVRYAETLRRLCRISFKHTDPGGEWPHSYGGFGIQLLPDRRDLFVQ